MKVTVMIIDSSVIVWPLLLIIVLFLGSKQCTIETLNANRIAKPREIVFATKSCFNNSTAFKISYYYYYLQLGVMKTIIFILVIVLWCDQCLFILLCYPI